MERIIVYRDAGLPLDAITQLLSDDSDSISAVLERHLYTLSQEIGRLRHRQHLIGELLGNASLLRESRSLTKDQWVALLASSGLSEDGMCKWHAEFERHFPEAHQDFLESLGIPQDEIAAIRRHSSPEIADS